MTRNASLWRPIVVAALIAGTADLVYASIHIASYYGMAPLRIFQSIARGVLRAAAMQGGWGSTCLGITPEFLLTLFMASVYIIAATSISDLRKF